jgi:hypothetical protein
MALEAAGLILDRTDGAASFVDRLRADGYSARVLNIHSADYVGVYDAIFIAAGWTPSRVVDETQPTSSECWIAVAARHEKSGS